MIVKLFQNLDELKPIKGYEIDKESVRKYTNPVTGLEHIEYQMISTEAVPRLKVWRKGRKLKRNETYIRMQDIRQLDMELEDNAAIWDVL